MILQFGLLEAELVLVGQRGEERVDVVLSHLFDNIGLPLGFLVFVDKQRTDSFLEIAVDAAVSGQTKLHLKALAESHGLAKLELAQRYFKTGWRHFAHQVKSAHSPLAAVVVQRLQNFFDAVP